jgi:uncharacterized protein involved in type VI secretion and phage assembly
VSAADDRALEDLLERMRTRFYGKYRGIVSDTGWCMPCVPYAGPNVGFAFLPEQGSGVWIEFEGGDVSYPIWVGGYWRDGEYPTDAADDVKVIVTMAPLELKLDDGNSAITITDPNGNTVTLDSSGITLDNGGSVSVAVNSSSVNVNDGAWEMQA